MSFEAGSDDWRRLMRGALVSGAIALVAACGSKDDTGDTSGGTNATGTGTGAATATGTGTGAVTGTGTGATGTGTGATGTGTGATGTGTGSTPACGQSVSLTMGTGVTEFAPLNDNDEVVVVKGPQGGWHIDAAGTVVGSTPIVLVGYSIYSPDIGAVIGGDGAVPWSLALADYDADTCTGVFFGQQARLSNNPPAGYASMQEVVCAIGGADLELTLEVEDLNNPKAKTTETVTVRAVNDPYDLKTCP